MIGVMQKFPISHTIRELGPGLRRGGSSPSRSQCSRGELTAFTLLEMAIVIAIIAVILAGGAVTFSASVQQKQFEQTKEKMLMLQKALRDHWLVFGRLPCPASLSLYNSVEAGAANVNGNFGREAATPGLCTGGTPAANFTSGSIVAGMVPTKTLQLPDSMAVDGWGRRIFYAVDRNYTAVTAAADIPDADTDVINGTTRITVETAAGDDKTTQAVYVLLSHGQNGHGGYRRYSDNVSAVRVSSGSSNASELENCDCGSTSAAATTGFNTVFRQAPYSTNTSSVVNTYDDLLLYATRGNLSTPKE